MTTITAHDILVGLWHIVNESPRKSSGLTKSQIAALKLLMEFTGARSSSLLSRRRKSKGFCIAFGNFAHRGKANESRPALRRRALATWIAVRIMRCRAEKTDEEQRFYWRHGYWRNQLLM